MTAQDIRLTMTRIAARAVVIDKYTPPQTLDALLQSFSALQNGLREAIQSATAPQIQTLIARLQKDEPIGADDIALMRLWIVGDAEAYVKEENNFEDWVKEANRLVAQVARAEKDNLDVANMAELQGITQDAIKTLSNITNFLESMERSRNFESSVKSMTRQNKQTLADILEAKLSSDTM